jgi:hypothetical protein
MAWAAPLGRRSGPASGDELRQEMAQAAGAEPGDGRGHAAAPGSGGRRCSGRRPWRSGARQRWSSGTRGDGSWRNLTGKYEDEPAGWGSAPVQWNEGGSGERREPGQHATWAASSGERERDDGVPIGRRLDGKVGSMAWAAQRDLKSCAGVQSKWRKWISSGSSGAGEDDKWVSPL